MRQGRTLRIGLALAILAACCSGCFGEPAPEQVLANVSAQVAAGRAREAMIELQPLLRAAPDHPQGNLLYADVLLQVGDTRAARAALGRARNGGADAGESRIREVEILVEEGSHQSALELAGKDCDSLRECVGLGRAALGVGGLARAKAYFHSALRQDPDSQDALAGLARIEDRESGVGKARVMLLNAIQSRDKAPDLWLALGELEFSHGQLVEARSALRKAAAIADSIPMGGRRAQLFALLTEVELANGDVAAAASAVERLVGDVGPSPAALLLRARVCVAQGDAACAERDALRVLELAPDSPRALLLMGALKADAGQVEQAGMYLSRALELAPDSVVVRKALARIQLLQGRAADATETLAPALASSTDDAELFALAATARGPAGPGTAQVVEQLKRDPTDPALRVSVATGLLAAGDAARAAALLDDPGVRWGSFGARRDALRALAAAVSGDAGGARSAIERLISAGATQPAPYVVAAGIANRIGDAPLELRALRAGAAQFPGESGMVLQLAVAEAGRGNVPEARRWLAVAAKDKSAALGHGLASAKVETLSGNPGRAQAVLDGLASRFPDSIPLVQQRVLLRLQTGDIAGAESVAASSQRRFASSGVVHAMAAEVSMAAGRPEEAAQRFRMALARKGDVREWKMGLASALIASGRVEEAGAALRELAFGPEGTTSAKMALATLYARSGRLDDALKIAANLAATEPASPAGPGLAADVLRRAGQNARALPFAEAAWERGRDAAAALRLFEVRKSLGRPDATGPLQAFLNQYPEDVRVLRVLATESASRGDRREAVRLWGLVGALLPQDAIAWNNLAWLKHASGDATAIDDARRAAKLAPGNPMVLDTLGWVLVGQGRPEEAVTHLQLAAKSVPNDKSVAYHLGVALAKAGRPEEARNVLQAIADDGSLKESADAKRLLEGL